MLIQFCFNNFKSFKDDSILDFTATKITEHSNRLVKIASDNILTTAAIYGANASGKSNVIEAFRYMRRYILYSFSYGEDIEKKDNSINKPRFLPFLFDEESKIKDSTFEVYFTLSKDSTQKTYNYGFSLNKEGITEEWLNSQAKTSKIPKKIFYRNTRTGDLDLSGIAKKSQENIVIALGNETLIVSLGAKLQIEKLKTVRDWFLETTCYNFGNPQENALLSSFIPNNFVDDKNIQKKIVNYLSTFDKSIIDFEISDVEMGEDGHKKIKIETVHKMTNGKRATIPLREESDGTLKMLSLYPALQDILESGSILFIDELNARLHPLLVRNFILTFLNPDTNKNHAQLVFTLHDAFQLSNNLLRRDEIWFTEKDDNGISTLYSLADFTDEDGDKIRKDENYEKNYLLGKYGAIPDLESFNMF